MGTASVAGEGTIQSISDVSEWVQAKKSAAGTTGEKSPAAIELQQCLRDHGLSNRPQMRRFGSEDKLRIPKLSHFRQIQSFQLRLSGNPMSHEYFEYPVQDEAEAEYESDQSRNADHLCDKLACIAIEQPSDRAVDTVPGAAVIAGAICEQADGENAPEAAGIVDGDGAASVPRNLSSDATSMTRPATSATFPMPLEKRYTPAHAAVSPARKSPNHLPCCFVAAIAFPRQNSSS